MRTYDTPTEFQIHDDENVVSLHKLDRASPY